MKKDEIKQKRPFAAWHPMAADALYRRHHALYAAAGVGDHHLRAGAAVQPQHSRQAGQQGAAITALIDQSDAEISSRTYQGLYLNDEFWSGVSQTFRDKKINVDGNCVDFSDSTLRCLKAYESMYPACCMRAPARSAGSSATIWTPALPFSCGKSCFRTARCTRS